MVGFLFIRRKAMLSKKICKRCFEKNEKEWNEKLWNLKFVDCPKEEIGLKLPKSSQYYNLFSDIFGNQSTEGDPPKYCKNHNR
jgi:hypothetical protein